jgi:hypothetical protein
MHIRA